MQANLNVPDWRIKPELDFLLILNSLLTQTQQSVMYEKIYQNLVNLDVSVTRCFICVFSIAFKSHMENHDARMEFAYIYGKI